MSEMPPVFGAGIWHFATYKDRYATDGYGPPVGLLEQILIGPHAGYGFSGLVDGARA